MRLVFTLDAEWVNDLEKMKQFEICLLSARLTTPDIPIIVQVPATFYWPTTWQTLTKIGYSFSRGPVPEAAGDIQTTGNWISVTSLHKLNYPQTEEHRLLVPATTCTLEEAIVWLDANRTNDQRHWLSMQGTNPLYWQNPFRAEQHAMLHWLQWSQWKKPQPHSHPGTRTFTAFKKPLKIWPGGLVQGNQPRRQPESAPRADGT